MLSLSALLGRTLVAAAAICLVSPQVALADGWRGHYCSRTAFLGFASCSAEVREEHRAALGNCLNVADRDERETCFDEAAEAVPEAREECRDQLEARGEVCDAIGEGRYDPDWEPEDFLDDFASPSVSNPWWPMTIGARWVYEGGDEVITVEILDETKRIEGVTCLTFNDVVEDDGDLIEDTDDWFAQARDGSVHYCGEISQEFETFEGDDPEAPELVDTGGSWKTGREGAKPGVVMQADPEPGQVYRQEWAFLEAEDMGEVLSDDYAYGRDPELDERVPAALAQALCSNADCVVTRDFTPIEPGAEERKYYAPGIGPFLEVNLEDGEIVELVACSGLAACALLP